MPRIDPYQLLKCLSVLLSPTGGIKSKDEVNRLASLMTKFSKKLVSKCIYVLILKGTDTELLDMFMSAGGWDLTYSWLSDGIGMKNWPLVSELVGLLLLCPVDIERLKGNNCPKLIKLLSKDPTATENVRDLACKVVEQWLAIVKGACEAPPPVQEPPRVEEELEGEEEEEEEEEEERGVVASGKEVSGGSGGGGLPVYKITIRDGKQVLAEVISSERTSTGAEGGGSGVSQEVVVEERRRGMAGLTVTTAKEEDRPEEEEEEEPPLKPVHIGKRKGPSEKKKDSGVKKRIIEKREEPELKPPEKKNRDKKVGGKKNLPPTPPPPPKPREKTKEKERKVSKEEEEQNERDKATLAKLVSPPISNLGKIPKKSSAAKTDDTERKEDKKRPPVEPPKPLPKDPKKYNISVEPRKATGLEKPKSIVKTYNSKFRSTGLEEAPPPPKSKKTSSTSADTPPSHHHHHRHEGQHHTSMSAGEDRKGSKRNSTSPPHHHHSSPVGPPPEKKSAKEEKPVPPPPAQPPKPKINFLQESDVFADALTAANPVKDIKKKKRRLSDPKKESPKQDEKKNHNETMEKKPAFKFYQDTLVTSEDKSELVICDGVAEIKEEVKVKAEIKEEPGSSPNHEDSGEGVERRVDRVEEMVVGGPMSKEEVEAEVAREEAAITLVLEREERRNVEREKNRLPKGILAYVKKKRAVKKSVQWRPDGELEATKYFELDETERVNVTKPFTDMKQMERINEREHILMSRKLPADDIMEEKTYWRPLVVVDVNIEQITPGKNSLEKDIQFARERTVLQALYFNKKTIPDTPGEPDLEIHATTEPAVIPLEDQTGNAESVLSYRDKPWPEPKGYPPPPMPALGSGPPDLPGPHPAQLPPGGGEPLPLVGPPGPHPGLLPHPMGGPPAAPFFQPGPAPPFGPHPGPVMGPPHPDWPPMGGGEGGGMMGGGPEMMMGGPGGPMMGPGGPMEIFGMGPGGGPPPPEFMGGPPPPHFMGPGGPPMFPPFPPQGPGGGPRPPWAGGGNSGGGYRQNGPGTWRHPSKGGNSGGGGGWGKTRGICNNYLKKGICRVKQCPFRHPPPR